jgi:hypothetical protein
MEQKALFIKSDKYMKDYVYTMRLIFVVLRKLTV